MNGVAMGLMYMIFGIQMYYGYWLMDGGHLLNMDIVRDSSGCVQNDLGQFMDKVTKAVLMRLE